MSETENRQDAYIDEHKDRFVEELKAFLRFPSVSAQRARDQQTVACARKQRLHVTAQRPGNRGPNGDDGGEQGDHREGGTDLGGASNLAFAARFALSPLSGFLCPILGTAHAASADDTYRQSVAKKGRSVSRIVAVGGFARRLRDRNMPLEGLPSRQRG